MLKKNEHKIIEKLEEDQEFKELEKGVAKELKNDKLVDLLLEVERYVMEVAYLEGYKQAIEEKTKEEILKNPEKHLRVKHLNTLLDGLMYNKKPAAVTADQ